MLITPISFHKDDDTDTHMAHTLVNYSVKYGDHISDISNMGIQQPL